MQIHVVIGLNGADSISALLAHINRVYPDRNYPLEGRPAWLVADDALAREVSEKLGIDTGADGIAGLVTTVATYYGRANPAIWQWMKTMYETPQPPKRVGALEPAKLESAANVVVTRDARPARERTTAPAL